MARQRHWYTSSTPSSTVPAVGWQGTEVMAEGLVNATLLRTRASFVLAASPGSVPPYYIGNSFTALCARVLVGDLVGSPGTTWPEDPSAFDDVLFHPVLWDSGIWIPGNVDFGRPEAGYFTGRMAGGVADSAAQRHVPGEADIVADWYVGPALGSLSAADVVFTEHHWIRCLIESDA